MKIIDDIVSTLNMEVPVRDIRQGVFHTGVLTDRCGLAATLIHDVLRQVHASVADAGVLLDRRVIDLISMVNSESLQEAAIGMAAINSLLDINEADCLELNARELILEKGRNNKVAIIGHFPFTGKIRESVKELWVFEKNPHPGDLDESESDAIIPKADVVAITGTAFTNHTIDHLLELCDINAFVVVLGDTAPLSPVLFDYGIDAISGTKVIDSQLALRCVSQGATYRQIKGIKQLTMLKDKG